MTQQDAPSGRRHFWAKTGIVTIIAAIIGAIATVVANWGRPVRHRAGQAQCVSPGRTEERTRPDTTPGRAGDHEPVCGSGDEQRRGHGQAGRRQRGEETSSPRAALTAPLAATAWF